LGDQSPVFNNKTVNKKETVGEEKLRAKSKLASEFELEKSIILL